MEEKLPMQLEIIPAPAELKPVLANLVELYAHDFSEFYAIELGEDGRFGYESLPLYWEEPDRHPFLVKVDGKLAGFVFVKKGSGIFGNTAVWDMAEFFIVRRYRKRGVGTNVAHEIWRKFPGRWEVRVRHANSAAREFWERAISRFIGEVTQSVLVEKEGASWHLFSFESRRAI